MCGTSREIERESGGESSKGVGADGGIGDGSEGSRGIVGGSGAGSGGGVDVAEGVAEGIVVGIGGEGSGGRDLMAAAAGSGAEAVGESSDAVVDGDEMKERNTTNEEERSAEASGERWKEMK